MLSAYQRKVLDLFKHEDCYIEHTEGIHARAWFYDPKTHFTLNVRLNTVEILFKEGYLKVRDYREFKLIKTTKKY